MRYENSDQSEGDEPEGGGGPQAEGDNNHSSGGWWSFLSVACWVAGVWYLFLHLKWSEPDTHPWVRFTSALSIPELLITIIFFASALIAHHCGQNREPNNRGG